MATHGLLLLKSSNKFYILHSALMDFDFSLLSLSLSLWTTDLLEVLSLLFIVFYFFYFIISVFSLSLWTTDLLEVLLFTVFF